MAKKNERKIDVVVKHIEPRYLQRKQVILYASISDHYLDDMIAKGAITPLTENPNKVGRHIVWFDRLEIDKYFDSMRRPSKV